MSKRTGNGNSRRHRRKQKMFQRRAPDQLLGDVELAAEIQSALLALAPSTGLRVDVDAEEGIVYLRGEVVSENQRAEAERIVRRMRIPGMKSVRNELVVNPLLPRLPHP